jgi:hypothetical protein
MKPVYIESVGLLAPGLSGWETSRAILAGQAPYVPTTLAPLKPTLLAPDVRRRTTDHIRLAIEVATEATRALGDEARLLPSVFASAESDGAITHDICSEVAKDSPQVSPTRFHNSVTNAPAGYWCMSVGSQAPSTSIAGWDATFAVGLLESCMQLLTEAPRVLLVAHDTPMPEPLASVRPITAIFGVALVLAREPSDRALAKLELAIADGNPETTLGDTNLETLRLGNPAARALPLLAALATRRAVEIQLPCVTGQGLVADLEPIA